jgi:N6-L-threonylcarbamoyladenine synthase
MYVLGIETSCDETASSVVKNGRTVLSNIVTSSLKIHSKYGGIVPEIAFRMQLQTITDVVGQSLKACALKLKDISLISVTDGPGLLGSLVVGISYAKALSLGRGIPVLGVNHLYGHIYSAMLERPLPDFPWVALVVSGGHTSLYYVRGFDRINLLGRTLDDASGEAFDKVAKILSLGYPGGPIIEKLALEGDAKKIKFGCSNTKKPLDFSFSGIKTGVLYYVRSQSKGKKLSRKSTCDIAASFQERVVETLSSKALLACEMKKTKTLVLGGGVAANNRLRQFFEDKARKCGIACYFPQRRFCTDNAAMLAGLGAHLFKKGKRSGLDLNAALD